MGNKLGRRRQVVDEKYTRPQGLYQHRDVDHKKLRKLILDSKLAPCYPGNDEYTIDLEECPICFLYYPSLNRSRCCMKGICTECFLQMKPPHSTRPTQCPFCKTSSYAVEYRGMRTKEEKGIEQVEEQRVIEAKIRMRQQELQDEEERMLKRQEISSSSRIVTPGEVEYVDMSSSSFAVPSFSFLARGDEIFPSQELSALPAIRHPSHLRHDGFGLDLEDIMVMEAIWLSIQEHGAQRNLACGEATPSESSSLEDHCISPPINPSESSPSGGLACAVAALAERQQMDGDSSTSTASNAPRYSILPQPGVVPSGDERGTENYPTENWIKVSPDSGRAIPREQGEWGMDQGSEVAEAGTSYAGSDATLETGPAMLLNDGGEDHFQPAMLGPVLPESFEDQMMLAMAVSLAEAQARPSPQGRAWH